MSPTRRRPDGERIGSFEIVRYLASGGMGDVYVGRQVDTDEEVALKFLGDSSPASLERFEREGRIASNLKHRNIVGGRGFGRTPDGVAYIAMELLHGQDLDQQLSGAGISPADAVRVALQVCDALEAAHARRIVHRDLKPQNIFVCDDAEHTAKVLDFGIARLADERRMTGTGMLIGTWNYMSPEQSRAEPDIDGRSDLWSLGVVLYECLAGRTPFDAPTAPGTLYQILFDSPPPLAKAAPNLPGALCAIVHRALSKPRDERYADAAGMRAALASVDVSGLREPRRVLSMRPPAMDTDATVDGTGLDATMSSDASRAPATVENRLTSVAFLRGAREPALVEDVARQLQGRVVSLVGDGLLVVFGFDRWNGDEPERAVRLAVAVAATTTAIGVATGRAVRSSAQVAGAAVDAAVALSRREGGGIIVDDTTASIARGAHKIVSLGDGAARVEPRPQTHGAAALEAAYATPFVGRDAECAMLVQLVESVTSDLHPEGCVVLGAVGMGKSRLRHEAMARVVENVPDTVFLSARCEVFRRDSPFAPIMDALGDVVDASVVKIFTAVADGGGDPVAAMDRARGSFEAILRGLTQRGPVVLTIDDAQWLDGPSQSAIRQVFENAPDLPLAIWLFGRPEAREIVQRVLPQASVVELKPLAKGAAEKLLIAVAGEANELVLERAGGHPLFLEELGRMFVTRGLDSLSAGALPPSIEGAHLAQLDQLDTNDREFVKRAAVFGRTAWLDGVVSLGADGAAIERLKSAQIFAPRPRSRFEFTKEFSFRSAVARDVAYGLWTEAMLPRLHERAATWLAAREGVGPDEIAQHWELAGETARAAEAYTAAAELSSMVSDMATTCAHVERALALSQDAGLRWRALVAQDHALQLAGDRTLEREGLEELERLAATRGPAAQAEVAWRKCYFARLTGDREGALEAGDRALALAAEAGEARWGSSAHNELAMLYASEGRFAEATEHAEGARRLANKTADETLRARAIGTQAYVAIEGGSLVHALDLYELSAARFQRAGDRRREAHALGNAAAVLLDLGRLAEAASRITASIESSKRVGNARTIAVSVHNLGVIRRINGSLEEADADQRSALREAERLRHPRLAASVRVELARLALARREVDSAREQSVEALHAAEGAKAPHLIASALAVRLLACARSQQMDASATERARALLPTLTLLPLSRAELLSSLFEAEHVEADALAFAQAVDQLTGTLDTEEDRVTCRAALAPRYQLDPALAAALER